MTVMEIFEKNLRDTVSDVARVSRGGVLVSEYYVVPYSFYVSCHSAA